MERCPDCSNALCIAFKLDAMPSAAELVGTKRAKAFIYVFSHGWLSAGRTVLWSGMVGNGPGMVRKIIPGKFLYITEHS